MYGEGGLVQLYDRIDKKAFSEKDIYHRDSYRKSLRDLSDRARAMWRSVSEQRGAQWCHQAAHSEQQRPAQNLIVAREICRWASHHPNQRPPVPPQPPAPRVTVTDPWVTPAVQEEPETEAEPRQSASSASTMHAQSSGQKRELWSRTEQRVEVKTSSEPKGGVPVPSLPQPMGCVPFNMPQSKGSVPNNSTPSSALPEGNDTEPVTQAKPMEVDTDRGQGSVDPNDHHFVPDFAADDDDEEENQVQDRQIWALQEFLDKVQKGQINRETMKQPSGFVDIYPRMFEKKPPDAHHVPKVDRLEFIMKFGALKSFYQAILDVVKTLAKEGFISEHHADAFERHIAAERWRKSKKITKFSRMIDGYKTGVLKSGVSFLEGENTLQKLRQWCDANTLRHVFKDILVISGKDWADHYEKGWLLHELKNDVLQFLDDQSLAAFIDNLADFALERCTNNQQWIICQRLQRCVNIHLSSVPESV